MYQSRAKKLALLGRDKYINEIIQKTGIWVSFKIQWHADAVLYEKSRKDRIALVGMSPCARIEHLIECSTFSLPYKSFDRIIPASKFFVNFFGPQAKNPTYTRHLCACEWLKY